MKFKLDFSKLPKPAQGKQVFIRPKSNSVSKFNDQYFKKAMADKLKAKKDHQE